MMCPFGPCRENDADPGNGINAEKQRTDANGNTHFVEAATFGARA
jgi:hypothetical protein